MELRDFNIAKMQSGLNKFTIEELNSFYANPPFLYPMKTSEHLRFPDISRGYKNGILR